MPKTPKTEREDNNFSAAEKSIEILTNTVTVSGDWNQSAAFTKELISRNHSFICNYV